MQETEVRYIPHHKADDYRADGWTVEPFDNHHGRHAMLATRPVQKEAAE